MAGAGPVSTRLGIHNEYNRKSECVDVYDYSSSSHHYYLPLVVCRAQYHRVIWPLSYKVTDSTKDGYSLGYLLKGYEYEVIDY